MTAWRYRQVDQRMRELLREQVTLTAWAIRADHIAQWQGNDSDRETVEYQRLKRQLQLTRERYEPVRFIYIMRKNPDGRVIFLVDSEREDSEDYSPPGQEYAEASDLLRSVFLQRQSATEGPERDRWGTWISAFVPLHHPYTDEVVAVLGWDVDASVWRQEVWRESLMPAVTALVFSILIAVYFGGRLLRGNSRSYHHHWDITFLGTAGVLLTVFFVLAVRDNERWNRFEDFRRMAVVQASALQQLLFRVGENYLEGIARFFDGSDFVDQREFAHYVDHLLNRPYARAWIWLPAVADQDRSEFERLLKEAGESNYQIWSRNENGEREAASNPAGYFPVCYIEPRLLNAELLGYDFGSHAHLREALDAVSRYRVSAASQPHASLLDSDEAALLTIFRPVVNQGTPDILSGVVAVILDLNALLFRSASRDSTHELSMMHVQLNAVLADGELKHLATLTTADPILTTAIWYSTRDRVFQSPIFCYGEVFMLTSKPGLGFDQAYPPWEGWIAAVLGFMVTVLVTALIGVLLYHRAELEAEVRSRTSDLLQSEVSYRGLFNAIRQLIYIQDEEGRFLDVNEGVVERYGYDRETFIGKTPEFLSAPDKNDMAMVTDYYRRAWQAECPHFEVWGQTRSGEVFPKEVWLYKGTYMGRDVVIAVATDISERKQAEEDRLRLQSQLMQAQKMESVGRLAGGVAHDFNNMLQAILGNTALARPLLPPGSPVTDYLDEIEQSAQRSARLTGQLLAFASKQVVQPRILDINDSISRMLKMLRRLIGEDIQLSWNPGPNLWPVKMDPGQLDQILANLTVNARDAIQGAGVITIQTRNHTCNQEDCTFTCTQCHPCDYVMIAITDNGVGMSDEVKQHLFEPFYTTKGEGKGTGLGLAMVFGIVHQNGGALDLESAPGVGTTIRILLPRAEGPVDDVNKPVTQPPREGRETILMVEDEPAILRMGMIALQQLGYTMLVASSPREALAIAREFPGPIDLLISDVILPEINGPEMALKISSLKPEIRCLFMSGYTADVIADRGVLDPTVHFIQKPFSLPDLAAKVRQVLDGVS
ncbi:MAG TPA: CHASE domain-containing protein [Kiritimatiellia bacterium]|nr:CHASE domain-containing protein [Kiritimatiellia bacterium]HMO97939.1 CHASE domain-containing protein [Kiritimatiellia bacterium]